MSLTEVWMVELSEGWRPRSLESVHATKDGAITYAKEAWRGALKDAEVQPDGERGAYMDTGGDPSSFQVWIEPVELRP